MSSRSCLVPRLLAWRGTYIQRARTLSTHITPAATATSTRHVIVSCPDSPLLSEVVATELAISTDVARSIIQFGSVYVNERPGADSNAPTKRCMLDKTPLHQGSYVRIYPQAGRYAVDAVDWRRTILYEDQSFVVVNKPAGIPCGPTASNYHENVMECVRKALLQCDKLYNPHRLDVATSGILVFGKSKQFAREFGHMIRQHEVAKTYKLLVVNSFKQSCDVSSGTATATDADSETDTGTTVSSGGTEASASAGTGVTVGAGAYRIQFPAVGSTLTHFMETSKHYPKVLHDCPAPDSKRCESVVMAVSDTIARTRQEWLRLSEDSGSGSCSSSGGLDPSVQAALRSWCAPYAEREGRGSEDHDSVAFCEVQLQLLTGRTHQLRAQVGRGTAVYVRGRERGGRSI